MSKRIVFLLALAIIILAALLLIPFFFKNLSFATLKAKLPADIISTLGLNTITVESNVNEYQLTLNNKQYLLDRAKKAGVFRKEGVDLPGAEKVKDKLPVDSLHGVITDLKIILSYNVTDSPSEDTVNIDTSPLTASVQFEEPRILTVNIFLLPLQIQRDLADPVQLEKTNRAISALVLKTLDALVDRNDSEERYFQYYQDLTTLSQTNKLPLTLTPR